MDGLAKEHVIAFYNKALTMFGDRPESVRWTSAGQLARYEALLDIAGTIEGGRILDFGCGKGDFCGFLKDRGIRVRYAGFDINENLIALGRKKHPEAAFSVFDIEKNALKEDFDYVFLCGVFNLKVQGVDELITLTLKKLFSRCRTGLAFNALSIHDPNKDFELHYVSPEEIFRFAVKELSPLVVIRYDRIPYDFTMFVYRERKSCL